MLQCFVVMGFGPKIDYVQKKTFDLDKTYKGIIKPAAQAAGYSCIRADEIQHAGNINLPMYEQLYEADLVIADLSTANPNAFFELGVRYALKPRTTIVIAEKGFKIPFDMGQVIVRHYVHLGPGIDFEEVEKFRAELTKACQEVAAAERVDSPVYTFLTRLQPPGLKEAAAAAEATAKVQTAQALATATDENERDALTHPFAEMIAKAMAARAKKDFKQARAILGGIKAAQGDDADSFVVQQLALLTYKSEDLDPRQRLLDARECLRPLAPGTSADPELLGLWGSIHKRLSEIGVSAAERREALDVAIAAYQSGYSLKTDYYNGINYAFLLDTRAAQSTGDDAIADRVFARRVREHVLAVCEAMLAAGVKGESPRAQVEQDYWVRATKVEALFGLRRHEEFATAWTDAKGKAPESWMVDSTQEQLDKLKALLPPVAAAGGAGG